MRAGFALAAGKMAGCGVGGGCSLTAELAAGAGDAGGGRFGNGVVEALGSSVSAAMSASAPTTSSQVAASTCRVLAVPSGS